MTEIKEIIGIAQIEKSGIGIQTATLTYYVKNEAVIKEFHLGQKIKVSGYLSTTSNPHVLPPVDDGIIRQGIPTNSWEEFHANNTKNWIDVKAIELLSK